MINPKMNIYVDCQVLQTIAYHRGMGKYIVELLRSLKSQHVGVNLILNKHMHCGEELTTLAQELKATTYRLDFKVPDLQSFEHYDHNSRVINDFFDQQSHSENDIYLIASIFLDNLMPVYPKKLQKACIFYDLIPYQMRDVYLDQRSKSINYFCQMRTLLQSDTFYCISDTVANDLMRELGTDKRRVVVINGGPIHGEAEGVSKFKKLELPERYFLMPTGEDPRKNNALAVSAFTQYKKLRRGSEEKLVLTSFFNKDEKAKLRKLSDDIVFTGNVNEATMLDLYSNAKAIIFPSRYEGLGLPILDAVRLGKPVVCSDIGAFMDISKEAFLVFGVDDEKLLTKRFTEIDTWSIDQMLYSKILKKYSWANTARLIIDGSKEYNKYAKNKRKNVSILTRMPISSDDVSKIIRRHNILHSNYEISYFFDAYPTSGRTADASIFALNWRNASTFFHEDFMASDVSIFVLDDGNMNVLMKALAFSGNLLLKTSNLRSTYDMLLEEGAVGSSRFEAEIRLDDNMLYSVIHNSVSVKALRAITGASTTLCAKRITKDTDKDLTEVLLND